MKGIDDILTAIQQGDAQASEELLPLVYDELRRLAAQKLVHEKPGQTLQATALVHEAFLRLVEGKGREGTSSPKDASASAARGWNGRGHFFAAAACAMRRILIENARRKKTLRRGGGFQRHDLGELQIPDATQSDDLLELDEALNKFALEHPTKARLVELRYFGGLTAAQAAEILGVSTNTADRYWTFARAWLHHEMTNKAE